MWHLSAFVAGQRMIDHWFSQLQDARGGWICTSTFAFRAWCCRGIIGTNYESAWIWVWNANLHGYVCGARPLKRMRVQHDRAQVCAQSVAVGNRWKVWSTMYALKFRKHNPSHAKMLFHPFSNIFLLHVLCVKKCEKSGLRESFAGVCVRSTKVEAYEWASLPAKYAFGAQRAAWRAAVTTACNIYQSTVQS